MKLLTSQQIKDWDQFTIQNEPITSIDLMERAALSFVRWYMNCYPNTSIPVDIFCGNGNNGGDGLAIARLLRDRLVDVKVHILRFSGQDSIDFDINLSRLMTYGDVPIDFIHQDIPDIRKASTIIDALLGTGVTRSTEGKLSDLILFINQLQNKKIAVDMPSGLPVDGACLGVTLVPDQTFSFQLPKPSFFLEENEIFCKKWFVGDIGLHKRYLENAVSTVTLVDEQLIKGIYKKRSRFQHKGNFGHALIIAGSKGMMGAAILSTKAAIKSGAGLVTAFVPEIGREIIHETLPEAMVKGAGYHCLNAIPKDMQNYAIGLGPGLGKHEKTHKAIYAILDAVAQPIVIDADALNILSLNKSWMSMVPKNSILTPHPREFSRLFGETSNETERIALATRKASDHQIYIVLKGAYTRIFTPAGHQYINETGNNGMATAGSGDVLTGIITGLLAQGYLPENAAILGVYLHGLAGDLALDTESAESMLASDIIANLGYAFKKVNH